VWRDEFAGEIGDEFGEFVGDDLLLVVRETLESEGGGVGHDGTEEVLLLGLALRLVYEL
jgi:hypothetical protein